MQATLDVGNLPLGFIELFILEYEQACNRQGSICNELQMSNFTTEF